MEIKDALLLFETLSQETRLRVFQALVEAGPSGMAAGALSDKLSTPNNTMSFHLSHLAKAGAVSSRRDGRSIIYSANFPAMSDLIQFMVKDCCQGEQASFRHDSKKGCSVIELSDCCPAPRS